MRPAGPAGRRGVIIVALVLLTAACGAADGAPAITVSAARVPEPAGPVGAGYMTVVNNSDGDDRLLTVETDVASSAEIHASTLDDGVMSMRQVDGVDVPAASEVRLEPGSAHVMLFDVDPDLAVGDMVTLMLTFERSGERTVEAEVEPLVGGETASEHPSAHQSGHTMEDRSRCSHRPRADQRRTCH